MRKKSNIDRIPEIQIDSPHDSVNVDHLEDFSEGIYILNSIKVSYFSPQNNYELRFEDYIDNVFETDSAQLPDRVWMDWDTLKQRLPAISFNLPVEFNYSHGQFSAGQVEGYEASFDPSVFGIASYDDLYGFGLFGEDVDVVGIINNKLNLNGTNEDEDSITVGRHYTVLERTPGAFRVLLEYENEIEKVTINLHYINPR